jgi:hypothetical protein
VTYEENPSPPNVQGHETACNGTKVRLMMSVRISFLRIWSTYAIGDGQSIEPHELSTLALEEHITNLRELGRQQIHQQDELTVAALIANAALAPTPTKTRDVIAPP